MFRKFQNVQNLKNNQDQTHISQDLTQNLKEQEFTKHYLKPIGRNIDWTPYITFLGLDLRLGAWIYMDQGFSIKNPKKIVFWVKKTGEMSQIHSFSHIFAGTVRTLK